MCFLDSCLVNLYSTKTQHTSWLFKRKPLLQSESYRSYWLGIYLLSIVVRTYSRYGLSFSSQRTTYYPGYVVIRGTPHNVLVCILRIFGLFTMSLLTCFILIGNFITPSSMFFVFFVCFMTSLFMFFIFSYGPAFSYCLPSFFRLIISGVL